MHSEPEEWQSLILVAWPLLAALILGFVVYKSLRWVERRANAAGTRRLRSRVVQVIASPAALALPLFFLSVALSATPLPDELAAPLQHAFGIAAIACMTWLATRTIGAFERRILRRRPLEVADNLAARRAQTQVHVIGGVAQGAAVMVGIAIALMTFPQIRQIGATLLASAGIIGLVAGIAAKPVFGNLIAGLQIAITQPIRFDDVVIVEGEWGRIEEITSAYVVVRIWDERRLVVPLQWFIEHPFENWTRTTSQLLGTAFLWLDYRAPLAAIRDELQRICAADERWDGRVCVAQVTDTDRSTVQVRLLVSARNSGALFDLRCAVRERMLAFLAADHPAALPLLRMQTARADTPRFDGRSVARHPRTPFAASTATTTSPGAEDVTPADLATPASK
ncbi:MAG TPA: mechanosensitive ion channel domain-containing protein [Dokdonella sp.]